MVMELPTPAQPHSVPWRHGDKTKEEERGRGRLALESGTEEQSAGQIEANAARHPGFPDGHESMFPSSVRSALLQVVFDRANLSDPSVGDSEVMLWLHDRLRPLLVELLPRHVALFFRILEGRNCSIEEQGVTDLNSTISSLSEETQAEIYSHIVQSLKGPIPLKCYGENYNQSFYGFLQRSFMSFQFPNLTAFLSLMPHNRMHQLVNSMPPSHLGDFLRRPDVVDNDAELCTIYDNYVQTPMFLET
ncbi:uncharacterized protein, partial [Notothenia coriiceps]|uniref:Uncharacterized protein n=1 Tax=Notothenia coriiceps TaxID=8208 RepID=A0A6I9NGF7_9TELE